MYGLRGAARTNAARHVPVPRRMSVAPALDGAPLPKSHINTASAAGTSLHAAAHTGASHSSAGLNGAAPSASDAFLGGLSSIHTASVGARTASKAEQVKSEIAALLHNGRYDTLLGTLLHWTAPTSPLLWSDVLQHREMTHVLGKIAQHQIGVLHRASSAWAISPGGVAAQHEAARAHQLREKLRAVYANILGSQKHLYAKGRRSETFALSAGDYENLIALELNNGKLDLASRWFQHMAQTYPDTHYDKMTHRLWLLKFEVYGGAKADLWRVEPTELYEKEINPRQSRLKAERPWTEVFNEYVQHQPKSSGSAQCVFDTRLVQVMFYSIAYSRNVAQLVKLVEQNWGISADGSLVAGFAKPAPSAPLYPDVHVLMAVVVAMVFNKQFVASMAYMNAFQQHYSLDLGQKAHHFWDQLFRWSEISTRYSEFRALQHYMRETSAVLSAPADASEVSVTLEEAKKSADFDYEGYLRFVSELANQRRALLSELWRCYHESGCGFSARPFQTYLGLIKEAPTGELCYEFLAVLSKTAHMHSVPRASYNHRATKDKLRVMRELYLAAMKVLVNVKGEAGDMAQIPVILQKWSMDERMAAQLETWAAQQEERYYRLQHERDMTRQEEEEDGFLGLM